jgi:PAS domain S-box-containing protein
MSADDPDSPAQVDRNRLSLALEAAGVVGIWDGDLVNSRIYADESFARIYGVDPFETVRGKPLGFYFQYIHPDDLASSNAEIERMRAGSDEYSNEHRIVRPDGSLRWVLARGRLVRDASGRPVRFHGVSIDVTERKQAENRQAFVLQLSDELRNLGDAERVLATATARLGAHLGAARVGYGQIQSDHATVLLTCGYANGAEPINGTFRLEDFGPRLAARAQLGLILVEDDVLANPDLHSPTWSSFGTRAHVSVPLIRDGHYRALLYVTHTRPHRWTGDEVQLIEEVAERIWDAMERARAERALHCANEELKALVAERTADRNRLWSATNDLMGTASFDGYMVSVNPAWTRMLGFSESELTSRPYMEFIDPEDHDRCIDIVRRMQAGEEMHNFESRMLHEDGRRFVILWTGQRHGDLMYLVGRDITAQRTVEEKLRHSQKMEAVGQLTGGIAHDFNNMLQGIRGAVDVMSRRITQGRLDEAQHYISIARQSIDRAATLTHRLLAFSRRQALAPQAVDLDELLHGIGKLIQQTVGPMIDVRLHLIDGCWPVRCDPNQLENAVLNLAINARDAMLPQGGSLVIDTAHTVLGVADVVGWEGALPGSFVCLCVRDTGSGMTPQVLQRAFEPFFTTKPDGQGTGLGLSQVYGFVSQSGGFMKLNSEVGVGTAVQIYLPRYVGQAVSKPAQVDSGLAHRATARAATVLLVEDEADIRNPTAQMLRDRRHIVIEAWDGSSALTALRQRLTVHDRIDILIADIGLPGGMNGRQLANAVRQQLPDLPVLLITGYAGHALGPGSEVSEGISLLSKPFSFEALAARVEALIATGSRSRTYASRTT